MRRGENSILYYWETQGKENSTEWENNDSDDNEDLDTDSGTHYKELIVPEDRMDQELKSEHAFEPFSPVFRPSPPDPKGFNMSREFGKEHNLFSSDHTSRSSTNPLVIRKQSPTGSLQIMVKARFS